MSNPKPQITQQILDHLRAELAEMESYQKELLDAAKSETEDNRQENREEELIQNVDHEAEQLDELAASVQKLEQLDANDVHEKAVYGSLIETEHGLYLVAVPSPMVKTEHGNAIGISTDSPFYKKMEGLKQGDSFTVNEMTHTIKAVW